jgi:hypothetical protein
MFKAAIWLALGNFVAVVVLSVIEIALNCEPIMTLRCDKFYLDNQSTVLMVFAALQLSNVWNGVCEENFYELIGSFLASFGVSIICGVLVAAKWPIAKDLQIIFLLICSIVYQVTVLAMAMPIYRIYNRRMHKKIGSDPKTQGLYKHHLLSVTLLKFDACFAIIAVISSGDGIFNVEGGSAGVYRFLAAIACIALKLGWVAFGWVGMTKEKVPAMIVFFIGFIMSPIYCVVWFILSNYKPDRIGKRWLVVNFVIYSVLALVIHLVLLIAVIIRFRQFDMGLLDTLKAERSRRRKEGRADEGFAHLDSDEEFDLDITFDTGSGVNYQRMTEA